MYVRMKRAFPFKNQNGEKAIAPRGWIGDLPDAAAKEAIEKGYAVDGAQRTATPVEPPAVDDGLAAKTKAELEALAKERGLDIGEAKTKADLIAVLRKP